MTNTTTSLLEPLATNPAVLSQKELDIKHILFPLDFSGRCASTGPFVEAMASKFGSKITLLSVAQLPYYNLGMMEPPYPPVNLEDILQELKSQLDQWSTKEFANLRVERVAELGSPAQIITEFARTHDVDLIMIPTHGYGPFRSLLLGSVTAKVLHDAECPVWTAPHMPEAPERAHAACRSILCAVDGTAKSVSLIQWASQFAAKLGASLRLVHVVAGMEGGMSRQFDRQFEEDLRAAARETIGNFEKSTCVNAPLCVAVGNIAESVQEEARRHGCDLIVIGRGAAHETLGRLRSHTYGIIAQSPCPVISV